jgi:hypothetical protein
VHAGEIRRPDNTRVIDQLGDNKLRLRMVATRWDVLPIRVPHRIE